MSRNEGGMPDREPDDANLPAWIFALTALFWVFVVILEGGLPYIIGSGAVAVGVWLLLFYAARNNADRRHELATSQQRVRELEAEKSRARERIRELELEAEHTREIAIRTREAAVTQMRGA